MTPVSFLWLCLAVEAVPEFCAPRRKEQRASVFCKVFEILVFIVQAVSV
jgi:hypothetical protein